MSNYSFNVTVIFSTQTRPRCECSTLFPTHGLIMFREAFPASVMTHTTVPTDRPTGEKEEMVPLALRNSSKQPLIKNWTFNRFFWADSSYRWMLLLSKCSLKWPSWCDWLMRSLVCCSVCFIMQISFYLCFAECLFACGVFLFFFCVGVWGRVPVIHMFFNFFGVFPTSEMIKLLFSDRISNVDA